MTRQMTLRECLERYNSTSSPSQRHHWGTIDFLEQRSLCAGVPPWELDSRSWTRTHTLWCEHADAPTPEAADALLCLAARYAGKLETHDGLPWAVRLPEDALEDSRDAADTHPCLGICWDTG